MRSGARRQNENTRRAGNFGEEQHDDGQRAKQMQIASLATPEDTTTEPSDALRNRWAHAVALMDANLPAFEAYVADIRKRIAEGRRWIGGSDHMRHFLREGHFITPEGDEFRVSHCNDAIWCREVCRRWPDVAASILPTLKPSRFDLLYPDLFTTSR